MHIKHQKTGKFSHCGCGRQWTFCMCLILCVCAVVSTGCTGSGREAITAGPRFMGHRPKARRRRHFRTAGLYLSSTCAGRSLRFWSICLRLGLPLLLILYSLPRSSLSARWTGRGWRMGKLWDYQTWPRWGFLTAGGRGGGVAWCQKGWRLTCGGDGWLQRGSLSLWVGGVLALLGPRLSLQILVVLGLDVLVIVRGGGTLQVGPVGWQDHQIVDLKNGDANKFLFSFTSFHVVTDWHRSTPVPPICSSWLETVRSGDPALLLQKCWVLFLESLRTYCESVHLHSWVKHWPCSAHTRQPAGSVFNLPDVKPSETGLLRQLK